MKKDMSNVDILAVLMECKDRIKDSWIDNIYQIDSMFIWKFRKPDEGSFNVLVQTSPLQRFHLTEYVRTPPKIPPNFCHTLRKYLRNRRVIDIRQYNFDRIILLEVGQETDYHSIVFEFFGNGNILLLDPNGQILIAQRYRKMKDRDVLPKRNYQYPPSRGIDIFQITKDELKEILGSSSGNITRTLTHFFNIKKIFAEEICLRAGIEKTIPSSSINDENILSIMKAIKSIFQPLNEGHLSPEIVYENSTPFDVIPIQLATYSNFQTKKMPSFNEGLDFYFGEIEKSEKVEAIISPADDKLAKLERIRDQQAKTIEELQKSEAKMKQIAEEIYLYSANLREVLHTITSAYEKRVTWNEIQEKIEEGKKKGLKSAEMIKKIDPANKTILIELNENEVEFRLNQSVEEVASNYYDAAKKMAMKIEGAKKALRKTSQKIEKLKEKGHDRIEEDVFIKKKRKRKWYEKFRFFISSDDFLVLGGRDITSNKSLFKRYMDTEDFFMHAEMAGAPYVVIKTEGNVVPETTLREAAQFAISYSRAWKSGLGAGDVYYVKATQVSETAPSGEYVPKGGIIVRGERTFIKDNPIKIAIGVKIENDFAIPLSGPPSAIANQTENYIIVVPGEISSGKLARQIKEILLRIANEEDKNKIKRISMDEITRILPSGNSKILET